MPYPACLRRMASPLAMGSVGVLGIAVGALVVATLWVLLCVLAQKVLCWL
jgi:xanthosine utilization system XapX-like protein